MATLASLVVTLGLNADRFNAQAQRAIVQVDRLTASSEKLNGVAKVGAMATMANQAILLVAALAPAAGAILAVPSAMAAAKVATATFKVATLGVADAMKAAGGDAKKYAEALKELSPAARSFVVGAAGIKESFKPIQQAVQQKLFEGLTAPLKAAAKSVFPTVKTGMVELAGVMNLMGKEALAVASTPIFKGQLAKIFAGTTGIVSTLSGAIKPLFTIVMGLATGGMSLTQRMVEWVVHGTEVAAAFIKSKEGAATLAGIAERAGDTLESLGRIIKNLGVALGGVFGSANADGGSLLTTIEGLTARFAAWAQSAQGQTQLAQMFSLLSQVAAGLGPILSILVGPLTSIATLITSMPPGVQSAVAQFLAFAIVAGTLGSKLGPLITGVSLLVSGITKIPAAALKIGSAATSFAAFAAKVGLAAVSTAAAAARMVVSMATAAAGFVVQAAKMTATMVVTAAKVVAGWVLMGAQALAQAARVAAAWVLAMGPIGWIIAAVVALAALIVANWDTIKSAIGAAWDWVSEKTSAIWTSITGALTAAWQAIVANVTSTWANIKSAISAAAQFVVDIFMNWTLPGLILKHWESIKAGAVTVWNAVVAWVKQAAANVVAGLAVIGTIPGKVGAWFAAMLAAIVAKGVEVVAWAQALPGKILAGLGALGTLLLSAGKDLVTGLINGVKQMAADAINAVKGVVGDAVQGAKNLLGIASPSKVFLEIGHQTIDGLVKGFLERKSAAIAAVNEVMGSVAKAGSAAAAGPTSLSQKDNVTYDPLDLVPKSVVLTDPYANSPIDQYGATKGSSGAASGQLGITVNMPNAVIREEADVTKIVKGFGYELAVSGI